MAVVNVEGLGTLRDLRADLCQGCAVMLRGWLAAAAGEGEGRPDGAVQ